MMKKTLKLATAPADPRRWSEQSQRSVSASWTTEYRDIPYKCWRCGAASVFTALDQKYTFEVKKAPIDQRRALCEACWRRSLEIERELDVYADRWVREKVLLVKDRAFLEAWLQLLQEREDYGYRPDIARKNMLGTMLQQDGPSA